MLAVCAAASGAPDTSAILAISGHGFGQGLGLSQWGAEERAAAGQSTSSILAFYYPRTQLGSMRMGAVRVLVAQQKTVVIGSQGSIDGVDARGRVFSLAPGAHSLGANAGGLSYPVTLRPRTSPLEVGGNPYHGDILISRDGRLVQVVNRVPMQQYLTDVVSAECPGSWLPAALEAQAIASRSFALSNLRPGSSFDVYSDDRSQNYRGMRKEFSAAAAAVAATRSRVLLYEGRVVDAFFSASDGGRTNDSVGAWGIEGGVPYFVSRPDPFDARSPDTNWGPVRIPLVDVYRRFPQLPESIAAVQVVRNSAGRARSIVFVGADGARVTVDGYRFQQAIGLRSTYLSSFEIES